MKLDFSLITITKTTFVNTLNVEADMKRHLFFIKPDIKEIFLNVNKIMPFLSLIFVMENSLFFHADILSLLFLMN